MFSAALMDLMRYGMEQEQLDRFSAVAHLDTPLLPQLTLGNFMPLSNPRSLRLLCRRLYDADYFCGLEGSHCSLR